MKSSRAQAVKRVGRKARMVVLGMLCATTVLAYECPTLPNELLAELSVEVVHDASTGIYRYRYTLRNSELSDQAIAHLWLHVPTTYANLASATGWRGSESFVKNTPSWGPNSTRMLENSAGELEKRANFLLPGESASGFGFDSEFSPGPVMFRATGQVDVAFQPAGVPIDEWFENCPGLGLNDYYNSFVGTTLGPVDHIPVTIDIQPGAEPNAINPDKSGVVPVAILGTTNFDVRSVDTATVRFGPAQAAPNHDRNHIEDTNRDGALDLVMHFAASEIGVECQHSALFLNGQTVGGQSLQGADEIVTAGCMKRRQ